MAVVRYTTWGSVRGCCGHLHLTREGAEQCLDRDRRGCRMQGGVSDRSIRRIESDTLADARRILASYNIVHGPGMTVLREVPREEWGFYSTWRM